MRPPTRALAAALALVAAACTALALALGSARPADQDVDERLNRSVAAHPGWAGVWRAISDAGSPTTWRVLAAVVVLVLLLRGLPRPAVIVTVAMAGAAAISGGVKVIVARPRPILAHPLAHAAGKSFPSGHALTSFVALGLLLLMVGPGLSAPRRTLLALACAVVVLAIGVSRLMLGVHYPTDVLGGWLLGLGWLLAVALLMRRWPRPISATPG